MKLEYQEVTIVGFILTWIAGIFTLGRAFGKSAAHEARTDEKLREIEERQEKELMKISNDIANGFEKIEARTERDFERVFLTLRTELERISTQFYTSNGDPRFLTVTACDRKYEETRKQLERFRDECKNFNIAIGRIEQKLESLEGKQ